MRATTVKDVRMFLESYLTEKLREQGRDMPVDLPDDCDLLLSGIIDSVGLLELIGAVQKFCDRVLLLEGGKILTQGEPSAVVSRYHELMERAA